MAQMSEKIGNVQFHLQQNSMQWDGSEYKPKSFTDVFMAFLDTANGGAFRVPQLCEKVCKIVMLIRPESENVAKAGEMFKQGGSFFSMSRVPATIKSTTEAFTSLVKNRSQISGAFKRKVITVIQESAGCVATLTYAFGPFIKLTEKGAEFAKKAFKVSDYATLVSDSCDYLKSTEDAKIARRYLIQAESLQDSSSDLKEALKGTQKLHMIKTMKAVCSLVGFVLGLAMFSTVASLPAFAITAASVSLLGTVLSTAANLHKDSMKYKDVQFFNDKHISFDSENLKTF